MHKVLVLYPHPQNANFRRHYEKVHLPLVAKLPGLLAYRHSFSIQREGGGKSPFYCIFEADYPNAAAMVAAMQSPAGQAVLADVATNFATTPATVVDYEVAD